MMEYILLFRNISADVLVMSFLVIKFFYESDGTCRECSSGAEVCWTLLLIFMFLHASSMIERLVKYNSLCWFQL